MAGKLLVRFDPAYYQEIDETLVYKNKVKEVPQSAGFEQEVARGYLVNLASIEGTSRKYGFVPIFYVQPFVADKNPLTKYESRSLTTGFSGAAIETVRRTREMMTRGGHNTVRDLSMVFRGSPQPFFIDDVHVNGEGNRIIAEHMFQDLVERVSRRH